MSIDLAGPAFNLIDEPWIPVITDAGAADWSIREALTSATQAHRITGELSTEMFAIHRLLLAILYRALEVDERSWRRWWRDRRLPETEIVEYLDTFHDRFDLLDDERPFFQVGDLHTTKGEFTELERLIADAPTGHPFMTTKLKESLRSLSFADAARWVVHCQAFDPSGIKSGAVGDDRVKGGRGYPIGVASAGQIGGLLWEGSNLLETLLLNLSPVKEDQQIADFAVWEMAPHTAAALFPVDDPNALPVQPPGPAANLTWQNRRIRLAHDGHRVTGVLICNGDRYSPLNLGHVEHMTAWRDSPAQAKRYGLEAARMPRLHDPSRSLWRGMESLLSGGTVEGGPGTFEHLAGQVLEGVLDRAAVYRVRAVGAQYINNASIIGEIVDDELSLPMRSIVDGDERAATTVVDMVNRTDKAVRAFGQLAQNLVRAAGAGVEADAREAAFERAFDELDRSFRSWLISLADPARQLEEATVGWAEVVRKVLLGLAADFIVAAGPAAWTGHDAKTGHDGKKTHIDSARAESWFRHQLFSIFPTSVSQEGSP